MKHIIPVLVLIGLLVGCGISAPPSVPLEPNLRLEPAAEACTSFCLDNGDHCVFGANQDNTIDAGLLFVNQRGVLKTGWDPSTSGEYARWISRYGSVTVVHGGYQMAWAGMNEAGLMFSTMALGETENPAPDETPPLVGSFWAQYQLDNYSTVEQVLASRSQVRIAENVDHYLFCDRTGECATIEFIEGEMVYHTGETLPVSALANSTYRESLTAWEDGRAVSGVSIYSLEPGCCLERAGLEVGDLIVAVDGVELSLGTDVRGVFAEAFANHEPGDHLELMVIRPGEEGAAPVMVELISEVNDDGEEVASLDHLSLLSETSAARFGIAAERMAMFEPSGADEAVAYAFDTLEAVSQPATAWSIVFDPVNLRMHFRTNWNPQIRFVDLNDLDLSCSAPVLMTDIHVAGAGDIAHDLVPYSHRVCLDHSMAFFEQYQRLDYPRFLIDILLGGLERFPCVEEQVAGMDDPERVLAETEPLLPPRVEWAGRWILSNPGLIWGLLSLISLVVVVWHGARNRALAGRGLAWILVVVFLGPLGLLIYLLNQRRPRV
jgi:penicillin V acylase-like amidase (Ntn superfamily)